MQPGTQVAGMGGGGAAGGHWIEMQGAGGQIGDCGQWRWAGVGEVGSAPVIVGH